MPSHKNCGSSSLRCEEELYAYCTVMERLPKIIHDFDGAVERKQWYVISCWSSMEMASTAHQQSGKDSVKKTTKFLNTMCLKCVHLASICAPK
mmetsp:Transcript_11372/g.13553  ORF Transcript_11372/g.13553 Transcript_11372/m.13553 type:complete len:93 (-) Transcript_11372:130-408(-)